MHRTLRLLVETEERTVGARFLKLLHTAHVGEVLEVADVPILESFFSLSLCHNAINLEFRCKGTKKFVNYERFE